MKTMFHLDMTIIRRQLVQTFGICVAVALLMAVSMQDLAVIGSFIAAMIPMLAVFSLLAYDEQNGWQSYRLAMPLVRGDVVLGRYLSVAAIIFGGAVAGAAISLLVAGVAQASGDASPLAPLMLRHNPPAAIAASILLGAGMALVMAAALLPPALRQGMTFGVRLSPLIIVMVFVGGASLLGEDGALRGFAPTAFAMFDGGGASAIVAGAMFVAIASVLYIMSLLVSMRLYATREF